MGILPGWWNKCAILSDLIYSDLNAAMQSSAESVEVNVNGNYCNDQEYYIQSNEKCVP